MCESRAWHPEWVEPNGASPMRDLYEARLMELLRADGKGLNSKCGSNTKPEVP